MAIDINEMGGAGYPKEFPRGSVEFERISQVEVAVGQIMIAPVQGNPAETVA